MATEEHRSSKAFTLSHFRLFRLAVSLGFKKITYDATTGGTGTGQSYLIDQEHAALIGQTLAGKHLDFFTIEFTTVASSKCWKALANNADDATVRELCISHKSIDAETPETCSALAELCTKLQVQSLHVWSSEFEDGSLNAFVQSLEDLHNATLQAVDIRDVSKLPPSDKIRHSKLDIYVIRNR